MRRTLYLVAIVIVALAVPTPARAGGGGHGGVCLGDVPSTDAGWVAVLDNCFSPQVLSVGTGEVVRWENETYPGSHTVTFANGPDSGPLAADSFAIRVNEPGSYTYSCTYHPGMVGTIEVTGPALQGAPVETLDLVGNTIDGFETTESTPLAGQAPVRQQMLIAFDPLASAVILLLFLPITFGATLRIVGVAGPGRRGTRIRPQLPWRREARADDRTTNRRR